MTKEKTTSQSPEEMAKAAQEAAVKAAMEQAQSMFGNIPGRSGNRVRCHRSVSVKHFLQSGEYIVGVDHVVARHSH